jgi:hypothetical protein
VAAGRLVQFTGRHGMRGFVLHGTIALRGNGERRPKKLEAKMTRKERYGKTFDAQLAESRGCELLALARFAGSQLGGGLPQKL